MIVSWAGVARDTYASARDDALWRVYLFLTDIQPQNVHNRVCNLLSSRHFRRVC